MSLYLMVSEDGEELDGVTVGHYSDFSSFRNVVIDKLESGKAGSKFPTLILHSDCDGMWSPAVCATLERELAIIRDAFQKLPPIPLDRGWQKNVAEEFGLEPKNLYESFIDIDGESLIERLSQLAKLAQERGQPILFT
ncbi:MAG TPA: Imm70 family immunity protein [Lacipirellulaceae bacterium]|jgi:hypothetical protein|nr:Imm70 family immunity protein [Lacipirellulaceae bacterium]